MVRKAEKSYKKMKRRDENAKRVAFFETNV